MAQQSKSKCVDFHLTERLLHIVFPKVKVIKPYSCWGNKLMIIMLGQRLQRYVGIQNY